MKRPEISVIVPVYNVERYLPRCIESLTNQTFTNLEVILVNDGSTDDSGRICESYAARDNRIKVIHTSNRGVSHARNTAINEASGAYIGFVDSDDFIHKQMYEILWSAIQETNADIAECGFRKISTDSLHIESVQISKKTIIDGKDAVISTILDHDCFTYCVLKLYKKELWKEIRFPEGKLFEDTYTTYRVVDQAAHLVKVDCPLYYYYQRPDSIVNAPFSLKRMDHCEALESMMDYIDGKYPELGPLACLKYYSECLHHLQKLIVHRDLFENSDEMITFWANKLTDERYSHYLKGNITSLCKQSLKQRYVKFYVKKISIKVRLALLGKSIYLFSAGVRFTEPVKKAIKKVNGRLPA